VKNVCRVTDQNACWISGGSPLLRGPFLFVWLSGVVKCNSDGTDCQKFWRKVCVCMCYDAKNRACLDASYFAARSAERAPRIKRALANLVVCMKT
jgi:hypothetical protein